MKLRTQFIQFDNELASHGVPPLTKWWRDGVGEWLDAYEADHVLELFGAAGRGSAKSTALYKLATFFTLFGDFTVPPGERHFAIVLSRLKEEASKGVAIISHWLTLLGVAHHVAGDVIEIEGSPRGIRVCAASVAASSGWRAYLVGLDERSKWPENGVEEMDAGEIETSASAMTATHEFAPKVAFGSAFGKFGSFYEAIVSGSDSTKHVLGPAATWVVAPHITEASCRRKEPRNENRFKREYACEFQAGASSTLDDDDVRLAIRPIPEGVELASTPIILTDASAGRGDSWTWCCATWIYERQPDSNIWCDLVLRGRERLLVRQPDVLPTDIMIHNRATVSRDPKTNAPEKDPNHREDNGMRLVISCMGGRHGKFSERISSGQVVKEIAGVARGAGAKRVYGDQFSAYTLSENMSRHGLVYTGIPWGNENKTIAISHLRSWLRDGTIIIEPGPEAEALRQECRIFQERLLPSGYVAYGARQGGHDDRVALLCLASVLDIMGGAFMSGPGGMGSPMRRPNVRHEIPG